jgi:hypothetical protein
MTVQTPRAPASSLLPCDEEALFREARRLRRRRWTIGTLTVAAALGAIVAVVALTSHSGALRDTQGAGRAGLLPTGAVVALHVAGPLAVAPDGVLYVTDVASDRVLVRLPDGRFRVVVGTGKVGFSGDGGPAVRAQLSDVSDLVFAPNRSLYLADGGRVRVVGRDGIIRTIAGDGHSMQPIANGTRALSAPLGSVRSIARNGNPLSIALSPSGQLFISTSGGRSAPSQILGLNGRGTLATVRAVVRSGPLRGRPFGDFGPIAIDAHGKIDLAGFNGWSIWQVGQDGSAREVGPGSGARRSGGDYSRLERAPDGTVYAEDGPTLLRITNLSLVPIVKFSRDMRREYFWLTYFAFAPNGTIYADEIPGDTGFEAHQQLLSVSHGRTNLLWQENNSAPK